MDGYLVGSYQTDGVRLLRIVAEQSRPRVFTVEDCGSLELTRIPLPVLDALRLKPVRRWLVGSAASDSSSVGRETLVDQPTATDPADPLGQPVRARAFHFLSELRRPATIEEIAGHLDLHPTGVRTHLARLEERGLLERRVVRGRRGRPRYEWAIAPGAMPRGRRPEAYAELARWLAGALAAGATTREEIEDHGYQVGRSLAPAGRREPPADALGDTLAAMGFQPSRRPERDVTTYELGNCPYRDAVHAGGRQVCALHAGITRGLLQRLAPEGRLADFVAKDPDRGGCLIEVEGLNEPR